MPFLYTTSRRLSFLLSHACGQRLHEQIETAIRNYDKLLIVLSEASLQSEWECQSGQRKLFPVRLVRESGDEVFAQLDSEVLAAVGVEALRVAQRLEVHWKEHDQFETAL